MLIAKSANIRFDNNMVFNFRSAGVDVQSSDDVTISNSVVAHIVARPELSLDSGGAFLLCSRGSMPCKNVVARNNIAAGANYLGFTTYAHECG